VYDAASSHRIKIKWHSTT